MQLVEMTRLIELLEKIGLTDTEIKDAIYFIESGIDRTATDKTEK